MFDQIKQMLIENLGVKEEDISLDAELINDLGINSLELADLILLCEDAYGIEIKDEDIQKFNTVGDVVNFLTESTSKGGK